MIKKILFLLSFIFLFEIKNVNAETFTITYDANDGSGRTKVVECEKDSGCKALGADTFKNLDDDPNDPMDDKVISGWSITPDGYRDYYVYEVINNVDDITLYGIWSERKDVNYMIDSITVTGDGVTQKENGDWDIPLDSSVEFKIVISESSPSENLPHQFSELSYIDLPDSFFEYFPDYVLEAFSAPESIRIKIMRNNNTYVTTHSKKYVKDHKLFFDIIADGTDGSYLVDRSTNIVLSFYFYGRVKMVENNGHMIRGVMLNYEIPDDTIEEEYLFPQGKIVSKYIDIDTGKELTEEKISEDVIWTKYVLDEKKINNYELIEYPEQDVYYLENGQQTLYYKYRKIVNSSGTDEINNPNTSGFITISFLLLTIIAVSFYIYMTKRKVSN